METQTFTNEIIISWLQYYSRNTTLDLQHVKILDITQKNKNVIPTVEAHKTTLVFSNAGIDDIFYRLWNAGLGECDIWYNEGSEPEGQILHSKAKDMINRDADYQPQRPKHFPHRAGKRLLPLRLRPLRGQ